MKRNKFHRPGSSPSFPQLYWKLQRQETDQIKDTVIYKDDDQKIEVEDTVEKDTEASDVIKKVELRDNEKDEGKIGNEKLARWMQGEEPGLGVALATVAWRISFKMGKEKDGRNAKNALKTIAKVQGKNTDVLKIL